MNMLEISLYVRSYYDIQNLRIAHANRVRTVLKISPPEEEHIEAEANYGIGVPELLSAEHQLKQKIDESTRDHPVRIGFLSHIKGIGPILSGGWLSIIGSRKQILTTLKTGAARWISHPDLFQNEELKKAYYDKLGVESLNLDSCREGIACFDIRSALFSYSGYCVKNGKIMKRTKGEQINYNPLLKTLCWKLADSFIKVNNKYKQLYDNHKARMAQLNPEMSKLQIHRRACRHMVKIFMSHLWEFWRTHEHLSIRSPYVEEYLGHQDISHWPDYLDR